MGAEVLNLIFGILTNICAKLNICASNSPTSASPKTLTAICVFARTSFLKGFFVGKKAKTQNAFNKRFGKKPAESVRSNLFSLFCFCSGRRIKI